MGSPSTYYAWKEYFLAPSLPLIKLSLMVESPLTYLFIYFYDGLIWYYVSTALLVVNKCVALQKVAISFTYIPMFILSMHKILCLFWSKKKKKTCFWSNS